MFRVIIAGGRKFNNYSLLKEKCDNILSNVNDRIAIVCGCAYGADLLGEKYAKESFALMENKVIKKYSEKEFLRMSSY